MSKDSEYSFLKEDNEHMKRYLTSLVIRKVQIKSTVTYYITLIRMAKIKSGNKYW